MTYKLWENRLSSNQDFKKRTPLYHFGTPLATLNGADDFDWQNFLFNWSKQHMMHVRKQVIINLCCEENCIIRPTDRQFTGHPLVFIPATIFVYLAQVSVPFLSIFFLFCLPRLQPISAKNFSTYIALYAFAFSRIGSVFWTVIDVDSKQNFCTKQK